MDGHGGVQLIESPRKSQEYGGPDSKHDTNAFLIAVNKHNLMGDTIDMCSAPAIPRGDIRLLPLTKFVCKETA
jgi:hypothetical protein